VLFKRYEISPAITTAQTKHRLSADDERRAHEEYATPAVSSRRER
jgi:hypothetical protein